MKRRLLTILSAVSLALLMLTCVAWVISHVAPGDLSAQLPHEHYGVESSRGSVVVYHFSALVPPPVGATLPAGSVRVAMRNARSVMSFPHWALVGLFSIVPGMMLWMHLLGRGDRRGFAVETEDL